jgi:hypothetical protein
LYSWVTVCGEYQIPALILSNINGTFMSHYDYSKNAIVLTSSNRLDLAIKSALNSISIKPVTDIPNLSALSTIARVLQSTKNTAFIRAELFKYIQEKGYPFLVVLDLRLDLGLEKADDPDNMKIFRAFLISYLIFSMGRGFDKLHLNLLMLYDDQDAGIAEMLAGKPERILSVLYTRNEQVNELIAKMKKDTTLFYHIFSIKFMPKTDVLRNISEELASFKTTIEGKIKIREKALKMKLASVSNDQKEPANVFFRANGQLYFNGNVVDNEQSELDLSDGDVVVIGHWTSRTMKEVSSRLKKSISQAMKDKNFTQEELLNIHLPEKCIIDGSIASVLAGIVNTDLQKFAQKKVHVSKFNKATLEQSQGFKMVKEFLVFE